MTEQKDRFRKALEQSRKGEPLGLSEEEFELFSAIQNDGITRAYQKDKCPECNGSGYYFPKTPTEARMNTRPCPTCHGTGEKKLDRPDREIEQVFNELINWLDRCKVTLEDKNYSRALVVASIYEMRTFVGYKKDQILALFPDEEDELRVVGMIRKQERVEIGLQIQERWSKVTSTKGYSPYKLVDFLGDIITKLNKGQALKEGEVE